MNVYKQMHIQSNYQSVLKMHFEAIIDLVEMKATFYGDDTRYER